MADRPKLLLMRLTVLGCNGTYPTPGQPSSGYLIQTDRTTIWVDCGSGTFAALQEHVDPAELDAIIITHEHADHSVDVLPFAYARKYGSPELTSLPVFAPASVPERLAAFIGREGSAVFDALDFQITAAESRVTLNDTELHFVKTSHPVPTLAVRVTSGDHSIAYTADTGVSEHLVDWAEGADVLLAEASYQGPSAEKIWPHHLTAGEAGELASQAGVGRLVLTHLWPTNDSEVSIEEASRTFSGPVAAATPRLVIET